ncbi:YlmH/Sll1252 family protein [Allobaculum sp. JKK-2023]|uniref:YlmH/Sll1252 family protein n=1 Tax=Allobaculum sp. JKK-2023 TaxID=3108943 RepID=UPI002B0569FE|nr:YlmH/Sll1252 family protein [Allobaculum sp. JKK-2023]
MSQPLTGHEQFSKQISNGIARYEKSGKPFMTGFLTPAEQNLAATLCGKVEHRFEGGRAGATRARLVVASEADLEEDMAWDSSWNFDNWDEPDWNEAAAFENGIDPDGADSYGRLHTQKEDSPAQREEEVDERFVVVLKSAYDSRMKTLSHSDVLGALMHSGLERDAIGDIAVDDQSIYVVCLPSLKEYIEQTITRIGHVPVEFHSAGVQGMPEASFEDLKINTASMRADCIVSALAHCSRTGAKDMICQGFVKVNDVVLESVKTLCNNDTISVRRVGKFRIGELDGVSRKGRLIVHIYKYQ